MLGIGDHPDRGGAQALVRDPRAEPAVVLGLAHEDRDLDPRRSRPP
jgi:hypothetical protein